MDSSTIPKSDIKANVCEAIGCAANATTEINVTVGDLGTINLSLCNDCKLKFSHPLLIDHHVSSTQTFPLDQNPRQGPVRSGKLEDK